MEDEKKLIFEQTVTNYVENEFIPKFMKGMEYDNRASGELRKVFWINFRFNKRKIYFYYNYRTEVVKYSVDITNNLGLNAKYIVDGVEGLEETFVALNIAMKRVKLEELY